MPDLAAVFAVWAVPGTAVSEINAKATTVAELVCEMNRFRILFISIIYQAGVSGMGRTLDQRLMAEVALKGDTLEVGAMRPWHPPKDPESQSQ
jgi:hypothetical protein